MPIFLGSQVQDVWKGFFNTTRLYQALSSGKGISTANNISLDVDLAAYVNEGLSTDNFHCK
jgi:hypothetical protein